MKPTDCPHEYWLVQAPLKGKWNLHPKQPKERPGWCVDCGALSLSYQIRLPKLNQ